MFNELSYVSKTDCDKDREDRAKRQEKMCACVHICLMCFSLKLRLWVSICAYDLQTTLISNIKINEYKEQIGHLNAISCINKMYNFK